MKDIPAFTTENGAAGLVLKEIPYRGEAYIHIHSSLDPDRLVQECVSFCRACGAERIFLTGEYHSGYPLHTAVLEYRGKISFSPDDIPSLFPVTEKSVYRWREIYNSRMKNVDNAATLDSRDERVILESGGAYFIHRQEQLLGIGWLEEREIRALVSVKAGSGAAICCALQSLVPDEILTLQVASTNSRAIRLYEKLGMTCVREVSKWYRVL